MDRFTKNRINTLVGNSGNSDVDLQVNVEIETKAIAYGMLCSFYAKGELSEEQLEKAVNKLDSLVDKDRKRRKQEKDNFVIDDRRKNQPLQNYRRKWL